MRKVRRYCGCLRTDCCLRSDGWDSYEWVPDEWADDEQLIENMKAREGGSGMRWAVFGGWQTRLELADARQ